MAPLGALARTSRSRSRSGRQEGIVFVEIAVIEHQKEFATVRTEALDRVRNPDGKYQRSPTPTSSTKGSCS